jgi:TIR domain-containing protein
MPTQPYDLFISFADDDRDWVEGYLLPALGLPKERVVTGQSTSHSESFQPGVIIVNEFERAVTSSRFTLLVLSRAYLSDQWSRFGEQLASYATVAEQRERMVPLLRERECRLPLHIEFRVRNAPLLKAAGVKNCQELAVLEGVDFCLQLVDKDLRLAGFGNYGLKVPTSKRTTGGCFDAWKEEPRIKSNELMIERWVSA